MLNVGWLLVVRRWYCSSRLRSVEKQNSTGKNAVSCTFAATVANSVSFVVIDLPQHAYRKMSRHRLRSRLTLAVLCMTIAMAHAAGRINQGPGAFAILAESLIEADPGLRWEFADTMLDVLLETYSEELRSASRETVSSAKRASKLRRWRRATQELVDRVTAARLRLTEGADAIIHVDAQHQVFLFVDAQPVAFSAPRPETERQMEDHIVARFCALHDCGILDGLVATDQDEQSAPIGSWSLQEERPPAYEIDGRLRCEFADVSERLRKQHACEQAADEAVLLVESLTQARRDGFRIDWQALAGGGSTSGGEFTLRVTAAGDYLHLPIVYLARVAHDDWQAITRWLHARLQQQPVMLVIQHGDALINDSNRS